MGDESARGTNSRVSWRQETRVWIGAYLVDGSGSISAVKNQLPEGKSSEAFKSSDLLEALACQRLNSPIC